MSHTILGKAGEMTHKNRVAVLGVVFSGIEKFIDEYLSSLEKQTYKDFDLILINDGFAGLDEFKAKYRLNIREIRYEDTPAKIREFAINYIKHKGYEYIIFTDSDDFFSENRVEKSIELLRYYHIVANDLTPVSEKGEVLNSLYLSNRIDNRSEIRFDFISDKNIFGFSNTSLRWECLREGVGFDKDLIAVDWYLFSTLLKKGCRAVFTNEAVTFYRIYQDNVVGLSSDIDKAKVEKEINVKLLHYKNFSKIDNKFRPLYKGFEELKKDMADKAYSQEYIEKIKGLNIHKPLWWEQVKLPGELNL
ncbi:MAG: glycosyltransferase [bacterium]